MRAPFVLVHGSWHGAWCWERVVPLLEAAGHAVTAVDLPGHGADATPLAGRTLQSYAETVCRAIDDAAGPVVLVAHSMGGVVATQAAEWRPDRIARIVYVCAFLPVDGQALLQLAPTDTTSAILPALVIDEPGGVHSVQAAARPGVFYGDCTPADAAWASAKLVDEALAPVAAPVRITPGRFGRVPRAYIRTTQDRCLTPVLQDRMLAATPCDPVVELATSHSPFFSQPRRLAESLFGLA